MNRILAAMALACALAVSACVPKDGGGAVIGQTKADAQIAKVSDKIEPYCAPMRATAAIGGIFVPEEHQRLASMASAALASVCSDPPRDLASALVAAAKAYEAIRAAGRAAGVAVPAAGA